MGATWSWQQVAAKMGHDIAKMAVLGSVWEGLEEFGEHFCSILAVARDTKIQNKKKVGFRRFLVIWEWLDEFFGRCWLQDGVVWLMLGRPCAMLSARWGPRAPR